MPAKRKKANSGPKNGILKADHQKFANLVAAGTDETEAYTQVTGVTNYHAARKGGLRLSQNVSIVAEIDRIRKAAEVLPGGAVLTVAMKRRFYYDVVMTAPAQVDENSHLCQKFKRSRRTSGSGEDTEEWETEEVWLPDKLKAAHDDSDLAGDKAAEKLEISGSLEMTVEHLFRVISHGKSDS